MLQLYQIRALSPLRHYSMGWTCEYSTQLGAFNLVISLIAGGRRELDFMA